MQAIFVQRRDASRYRVAALRQRNRQRDGAAELTTCEYGANVRRRRIPQIGIQAGDTQATQPARKPRRSTTTALHASDDARPDRAAAMRRERCALALHMRDFIADTLPSDTRASPVLRADTCPGNRAAGTYGTLPAIAAALRLRPAFLEILEELLARELLAEQHQLQRPPFPFGADAEAGRQHRLPSIAAQNATSMRTHLPPMRASSRHAQSRRETAECVD